MEGTASSAHDIGAWEEIKSMKIKTLKNKGIGTSSHKY
jgi:hypothetical protein